MNDEPCQCWTGPVVLHAYHCCFAAGMREAYRAGWEDGRNV